MTNLDRFLIWFAFMFTFFFTSATGELRRIKTEYIIEQNHAEIMKLITTKYQTEAQFLHSVKTAKLNRIKEVKESIK